MRKLLLLLSMCMAMLQLFAQSRTVTGRVTDDKGSPVAGASVLVKGTTIGTTANDNGNFSLSVPQSAKTLVISALNFTTFETAITGSTVNVSLKSSNANLDEVVVVGYSNTTKQ